MRLNTRHSDLGLQLRIDELLSGVKEGSEDPVLAELLGHELADIARRTGINSLVINPGSTSTKVDVFSGLSLVARDELPADPDTPNGIESRVDRIVGWLESRGLGLQEVTGIASRGGFMSPVPTGTYPVTDQMIEDLSEATFHHPANLSIPMAVKLKELAGPDVEVTVTDPVVCDEIDLVHRITGTPAFLTDGAAAHYLNLKAACKLVARRAGADPREIHLIACHMGGGTSAARFSSGRMVQALHAFGSLPSANRSGALPYKDLLLAVADGRYGLDDLRNDIAGSGGGLLGLVGTTDFRALFSFRASNATREQRMKIDIVVDFFATRVAAGILELSASVEPADAVVLTGGLARSDSFCSLVESKIHLGIPVLKVPGSIEAESLAAGFVSAYADPESRMDYATQRDSNTRHREAESKMLATPIFEKGPGEIRDGLMPSNMDELISAAIPRGEMPAIALIGADNEEALLAAKLANQDHRLARFVLLGDYGKVSSLAWELDIPLDDENFYLVDTSDPATEGVQLLVDGVVDTVMKGSVTTSQMLKAYFQVMKKHGRVSPDTRLSHLCMFDIPGRNKLVSITDAAINPNPDKDDRVIILENSLRALHSLGLQQPKVAVISATEKPSDKVASSVEGKEIAAMYDGREDALVDGPISVDLSLSEQSAREKGYQGKIQGDADLLLVPDLDSGNAIYKSFTTTAGATAAGTVVGGDVPLILTSRGDSSRTKLASIALSLLLARAARNRRNP